MESQGKRMRGTVKWFSGAKGFDFITPDDGSDDLFVHQSSIKTDSFRTLADGEAIEFSVAKGEDGRTKAIEVTALDGGAFHGGGRGGRGGSHGRSGFVGRGGRGGGGWRPCYVCGEMGHMVRDCYVQGGGGAGRACYTCGEMGHMARDCYQGGGSGGGGGGGAYYNCGVMGHMARDCYQGSGSSSGGGGGGASSSK